MIIPTSGRLVLQKIKETEKPQGLVIVPNQQPKQDRYRVSNCDEDSDFCLGQVVYIEKYKGTEIVKDNETYLIVNDEDIVGYEAYQIDIPDGNSCRAIHGERIE